MKKGLVFLMALLVLFGAGFVLFGMGHVVAAENTVCCEKTTSGAFCQNVPAEECSEDSRAVPTSCESTSYCQPGTCYDSDEGTCLDNTPQIVCNENDGVWGADSPPQCELGCCLLGDQAAFTTLVRCKKLSSFLGVETNYDTSLNSELACIASVQERDKGACVFEFEFEKTCKFITRAECEGSSSSQNGTISGGTFYKDKLCSAEELGTNCGPSDGTVCLPGKDEVYFVDTCGNPANIYDASKRTDKDYWTNVKSKFESCGQNSANANSKNCGNCDYLLGSYCRSEKVAGVNPSYGDFICADLNCKDSEGKERLHGESWCVGDGETQKVGSRFYRQICLNSEIITEPCADFRNEECIEDSIKTNEKDFSQAACRVNRWQDCISQADEDDCENVDRRDCVWIDNIKLGNRSEEGVCLPKIAPGLKFWEEESAAQVCGLASKTCTVKFEKGLFGGKSCKENCECLEDDWLKNYADSVGQLGDCGEKANWLDRKIVKPIRELLGIE